MFFNWGQILEKIEAQSLERWEILKESWVLKSCTLRQRKQLLERNETNNWKYLLFTHYCFTAWERENKASSQVFPGLISKIIAKQTAGFRITEDSLKLKINPFWIPFNPPLSFFCAGLVKGNLKIQIEILLRKSQQDFEEIELFSFLPLHRLAFFAVHETCTLRTCELLRLFGTLYIHNLQEHARTKILPDTSSHTNDIHFTVKPKKISSQPICIKINQKISS